jgi:hypothetical protein
VGLAVETLELTKEDHISVFPNPAREKVNIAFSMLEEKRVEVMLTDLIGHGIKKMEKRVNNAIVSIDVGDLPGGLYLLIIQYDDQVLTEKIVIY